MAVQSRERLVDSDQIGEFLVTEVEQGDQIFVDTEKRNRIGMTVEGTGDDVHDVGEVSEVFAPLSPWKGITLYVRLLGDDTDKTYETFAEVNVEYGEVEQMGEIIEIEVPTN